MTGGFRAARQRGWQLNQGGQPARSLLSPGVPFGLLRAISFACSMVMQRSLVVALHSNSLALPAHPPSRAQNTDRHKNRFMVVILIDGVGVNEIAHFHVFE